MQSLRTKDSLGGVIYVYSHQVMIIELRNRNIHFHCDTGITSCKPWTLTAAKEWLKKHNIKYRNITENKLACMPFVCGFRGDSSLVYNRVHYDPLPEDFKMSLSSHSITDYYQKQWTKMDEEEEAAAAATRSSTNTIYCNPCTGMHLVAFEKRD